MTDKKIDIVVCTPSIDSKLFNKFYKSLICTTKENSYVLRIFDNRKSSSFSHPKEINTAMNIMGDYLVVCDDDIEFQEKGWLEYSIDRMEEDESIGIASPILSSNLNVKAIKKTDKVVLAQPSACFIMRKTDLRMDERFLKYEFDLDFCYRMWEEKNRRVVALPFVTFHGVNGKQVFENGENMSVRFQEIRKKDKVLFNSLWSSDRKSKLIKSIEKSYPGTKIETGTIK